MRLLYLIDSSVYIFRAWFSIGGRLVDEAGDPANAVYGYGNFLLDFLEGKTPEHALAAFDRSLTTCFRNDIYPAYKANRPEAPEDLKRQIGVCEALTRALGVTALSSDRYEADDLIGTVATRFRPDGFTMRYLTSDKDYAQLLEPGDRLVDASGRRNLGCDGVLGAMGVRADQVPDLLGLAGDSVDNIPGVPGIGLRTAQVLLNALGSLEGIYVDLERVGALPLRGAARIRRLLAEHRDIAFLSRRLATIHRDAPLVPARDMIRVTGADGAALDALALPLRVRRRAELRMGEEGANALVNH
ncbi:5'-3' exonuclease H3TH domain-containing protein [Aquisalimonas sp.]|uniref:5'-3' exonuclease n=1 Tax=Aquisalimonas sp. TaxID=1872621 RepID=UPI0025C650C9|nr:5'-3' exonuclease H3TH domain-containing protein [Aquisalimonas sp.]